LISITEGVMRCEKMQTASGHRVLAPDVSHSLRLLGRGILFPKPIAGTHMQMIEAPNNEAAILGRVIQPDHDDLSRAAARAFLRFDFMAEDRERMHELAVKNQAGKLTAPERHELDDYLRVGRLLDLLGAKARLSLRKHRDDA
jgi:hypothetical protein